ncbi:ABC transporter ATP-binding protein [Tissierella carlieri]|uniref:ABC transporter ATP-binding protein n=1 Tax=Tissierella carlieri TaxID=689904 RepID=A0ABT1SC80_9FIRM|nr:ABC transporter ATP-binding protein [Tissierella carlieri]MBU5313219.1 ABC transporter ATP-binding protein [Tissierella carlieri]MCQ4923925.1 ABC transporter ATP-binding protein [Tissierella carlieri]MDU5082564.1 ABC transporter ATP-binding protein [Bacillota bacterium]
MLEIKGISASYGPTKVLHDISLKVEEGKITTLIGGNGAGKTTTLNCIMGVVKGQGGSISWKNKDITNLKTPDIVSMGISLIPEGRHIFPDMTVMENLELGAYKRKDKKNVIKDDLDWIFDTFPVLKTRYKQLAGTMSGGEQQMLAIGRSLMGSPELILMDEPSMGLAPIIVEEVFRVIEKIKNMGKTILLVEQNASLALSIAHYGYVIELGHIALEGTGQELLNNSEVEKAYLGL